MKYTKFATVVFVLYFLGYVLGPTITDMLVKEKKDESSLLAKVEYKGATYKIDLAEYRDADLPLTIKIEKPVTIPTIDNDGEVRLGKGDTVNLLNRKDNVLIIESIKGNGKGEVAPQNTDIYTVLAARKFEKAVADGGGSMAGTPPVPVSTPVPTPTPAPAPGPEPVAVVDPTPPPTPAVEPEPTPTPPPAPVGEVKLTEEQIIELMKKSIDGGAVKEFKTEQVKGWKASGDETIDGSDYQTGLAAYEAATIFGVRPVQAKALIKDGKIERWVYAKSGMEIQ
jgi:hypothetical protein